MRMTAEEFREFIKGKSTRANTRAIFSDGVNSFKYSHLLAIKPLSVNAAWKGRRYKTKEYKQYEKMVLRMLPNDLVVPACNLIINYEFGFSNISSDIDNPVKLITDILQKKYSFNDSQVYEMNLIKRKVKKGAEYIKFKIEKI